MKKYKLGEIATIEISGVDKKVKEGEHPVKLCNFVDVYYNWAITRPMKDKFMEATARQTEIDRFTLHKGQVALTKDSETRFDIGISTYIADDFNDVILGYHNALITPNYWCPIKLSSPIRLLFYGTPINLYKFDSELRKLICMALENICVSKGKMDYFKRLLLVELHDKIVEI